MFPADPMSIASLLDPMGLAAGPTVPTREWRELYAALDCVAVAAIHPFYTASYREFTAAGRPIVGSAPVGVEGTEAWLEGIGAAAEIPRARIDAARDKWLPVIKAGLEANRINARITMSGYEGSELIVARLLVEGGADLRYVGTACPHTPWSEADRAWLADRGVQVQFRASLEQDLAAMHAHDPELVIGTTPIVQKAKELAKPAMYFTNLVSARPLFGPAGVASLAGIINPALRNRERFESMLTFFEGVGIGHDAAGYGFANVTPTPRPEFKDRFRRHMVGQAKKRKAEEMI
jgi:chlorophyllide a reductase subunit Y